MSAVGGFAGAALAEIIRWGVARGLYSNEAGMGSATIVHSSATNEHPATQGFWGVFEVFVDTILVCSVTAFLILTTDAWMTIGGDEASNMTAAAMADVFGSSLAGMIVTISLFVFGFTTVLMVTYFGEKQAEYLFGHAASIAARYIVIAAIFFGAIGSLLFVWSLLDIMLALVVIPNLITLVLLSGKVKEATTDYFKNQFRQGHEKVTEKQDRYYQ